MQENMDQKNFEYRHFLRSQCVGEFINGLVDQNSSLENFT